MAVYFLNLKSFSRAAGSSAVAAAAYRAGERLRDERTGKLHDHSQREDVIYKEIILPAQAAAGVPAWMHDRGALWNAVELAEPRKNSRVAREYLVLLPHELAAAARLQLARGFAAELSDRYGFGVDLAIHAPRQYPGSDPRNFHAHLLATTREITAAGLGEKTQIEWHDVRRIQAGLTPSSHELLHVRQRWAERANHALAAEHLEVRIDHRSLAAQVKETSSPAAAVPASGPAPTLETPATLEEVRRHAREAWLSLRSRASRTPEVAKDRGQDEDLVR